MARNPLKARAHVGETNSEERLEKIESEIDAAIDFFNAPRPLNPRAQNQALLTTDEPTLRLIRSLGALQCTQGEAAAVMGVAQQTFSRFLGAHLEAERAWLEGREGGKVSLRRLQWIIAKKSAVMAIWLGKQYLGQRDSDRVEIGGISDGVPINIEHGKAEGITALLARARLEQGDKKQ